MEFRRVLFRSDPRVDRPQRLFRHRGLHGRRPRRILAVVLPAVRAGGGRGDGRGRLPAGLPCLRLSGLYLAMATLGFTLIVQEMLLQLAVITHGSEGMPVPAASLLGFTFDSDYRKYYLLLGVTTG